MTRPLLTLVVVCLVVATACGVSGDTRDGYQPPLGAGPSSSAGPDDPVSLTPEPGSDVHDVGGRGERVRPRRGMADLRRVPWEKARQASSGRALRVTYWSGVEPCNVLDHIEVAYSATKITVTLYEGHDPEQADVACIEIALLKTVVVKLEEPVDGRKIVDGAK